MRHLSKTILSAVDTTSQDGQQIDSSQLVSCSILASFGDSTAYGTVKLQGSNDIAPARNVAAIDGFTVTNWTDIPSAVATVTSGGSVLVTVPNLCCGWIRAVFTRSSGGSSTIEVNLSALGV